MHNVIETIDAVFNLPIGSSLSAIQEYNQRASNGQYIFSNVLPALLGFDCEVLEDPDHARVQVGYVIQLAINAHNAGEKVDPEQLYIDATAKTHSFIKDMSWVFAKPEKEVKLGEDGKPVPKRGSKAIRTYEVYCELIESGASRKDIIEAFQDRDVMGIEPMTKSGATTYFYNMKKKYDAENSRLGIDK